MLETFCASLHLKSLLMQHHDMPVIEKFKDIIEKATKDHSCDPFAGILFPDPTSPSPPPKQLQQQGATLSE
jgi:hypothetical protein